MTDDKAIDRHGAPGNGGIARNPRRQPPGGESSVLYLEVEDIRAAIDTALSAGGTLDRPYSDIGGAHGCFAIVQDPEGNRVGLWSAR